MNNNNLIRGFGGKVIVAAIAVVSVAAIAIAWPDTTAPGIISVRSSGVSATAAKITWFTNEPATSKIYYSSTTPVVFADAQVAVGATNGRCNDAKKKISQTVNLTGLAANTIYYFVVESTDLANNSATSIEYSFATKDLAKADKVKDDKDQKADKDKEDAAMTSANGAPLVCQPI